MLCRKYKFITYWEHFSKSRNSFTFLPLTCRKDAGNCLGAAECHGLIEVSLLRVCVLRTSPSKAEHTLPRGTNARSTYMHEQPHSLTQKQNAGLLQT